ncbi:MAG: PAS domain-containing protein [Kofleriaceae bacterium]
MSCGRGAMTSMGGPDLRAVLEHLPDFIVQFDREGRHIYVNPALERTLGVPTSEFLGKTALEIGPNPEASRQIHESVLRVVAEGVPNQFDLTFQGIHGELTFEVRHLPERDETGAIVGVLGFTRDVTERTRALAALRENERAYRSLAENTPDIIVRWDRDMKRIFGNPAFEEITGIPLARLIGGKIGTEGGDTGKTPRGSYLAELGTNVARVFQTGQSHTIALTRASTNGDQILETRFVPERDEHGEVTTVLGIARDITKLKESEREARTLADHSPDLISRFDASGRYIYVNQTLVQMSGVPASAYAGRHVGEVMHDRTGKPYPGFAALHELVMKVCRDQYAMETEIEIPVRGKVLRFDVRLIPELSEVGNLASVLVIGRDITGRRALEEQLLHAQKLEAVGQLAGSIAHDFNNMLVVIQMHASIALRHKDLDAVRSSVREIVEAAERAGNLTRELLTFSRRRVASLVPLDLGRTVTAFANLLGPILGSAISFELAVSPQLPRVRADAGMIEQSVMNLAINARDAMATGGTLRVVIEPIEIPPAHVTKNALAKPGPHVCLSVHDTGCGIPVEAMPKIFEPFFTTKAAGLGTGLGLATVFGIVQQHDGWIEVDSVIDQGTTFRLFFPALAR